MRKTIVPAIIIMLIICGCANFMQQQQQQQQNNAGPKTTEERFIDYLNSRLQAYEDLVDYHRNAKWHMENEHILVITWFDGGDLRVAKICEVNARGKVFSVRNVYNWADQDKKYSTLPESRVNEIKAITGKLIETKEFVSREKQLIISFRKGVTWYIFTYDVNKIPDGIKKLFEILGMNISEK